MSTIKSSLFALLLLLGNAVCAQNAADSADQNIIFTKAEVEADFPGGIAAWRDFLIKNLNVDVPGNNGAPAGHFTVIARFIVTKTGELTNIQVENAVGFGMEQEVIRVIKKSGKWIPAVQNGRKVNAYRRQPITFAVEDEELSFTSAEPYTFFTGVENELTIAVDRVDPKDVEVNISSGNIRQIAAGKYLVKVNKPGRVILEVRNTKKNKLVGTASFEVKNR